MKLFLLDKIDADALKYMRTNGIKIVTNRNEADAIYAQLSVVYPSKKVKMVATPCTGTDHVKNKSGIDLLYLDKDWKESSGVTVSSTAEHTFGLIIAAARGFKYSFGALGRPMESGVQLMGRTIGIIGYGRIGRMVAKYANAYGMKVLAYDIEIDDEENDDVEFVELEDLLGYSDIITVHVPLNEYTEGMLSFDELKLVKNDAIIVNTSRALIFDEAALCDKIVTSNVKFASDFVTHPLLSRLSRVVFTPHIGGYTEDARKQTDMFIAKKIVEYADMEDETE